MKIDEDLKDSLYLMNNGILFFFTTLAFVYLGKELDEYFGTRLLMLIFGFAGVGIGLYVFFIEIPRRHERNKKLKESAEKLEKDDKKNSK